MIETSKLRAIGVLSALALAGCSLTSGGEIPCVEDASCPNDFPVCGPAGKCIAGTSTGNVTVAIVGAAGKQAGDPVRGTVSIQVAARSTSGVKSVSLAGGGKTFTPATGAAGPVYDITVDTTTLADGSVSFTATVTPGDASAQPVSSTAFALTVDNTAPVLSSAATIAPVALGSLVTLDVTATEALGTLSADVLLLGDVIGHGTELSAPTGNVHHLGFAVVNSATPATYSFSVTATDLAGNPTAVAFTKPFTVAPNPTSDVTVDPANVTNGDAVKVTTGFTGGTAVISALPAGTETLPASPAAGQQITLHPAADTVYTLSVTNAAGVTVSSQVRVLVAPTLTINLVLDPSVTLPIDPGQTGVNLQATLDSNATQVTLEPGPLTIPGNGIVPISPTATTTYTLVATNSAGREFRKTTTVTVKQLQLLSFTGPATVTDKNPPIGITLVAQFTPQSATATVTLPSGACIGSSVIEVNPGGPWKRLFNCAAITTDTSYRLDLTLGTAPVVQTTISVLVAPDPAVGIKFGATPPVLPFSPLPNGIFGIIAQFCAGNSRCSATMSANGASAVAQPNTTNGSPTPLFVLPTETTTYNLVVTNDAGATASSQMTVPVHQGTVATTVMSSPRIGSATAMLQNGKVLVAGGSMDGSPGTALTAGEIFDPATGKWSDVSGPCSGGATANLHDARFAATATTLQNGSVLIVGGSNNGSSALQTAEVYDPSTDCFSRTTNPPGTARTGHTAISYNGGSNAVLIGGGNSTCEVFAQGSTLIDGTFTNCGGTAGGGLFPDMQVSRTNHFAVLLGGRYVVVGGGNAANRSADIYDTNSGGTLGFIHLSTTTMVNGRTSAAATALSNGKALIVGGSGTGSTATSAELFTFDALNVTGTSASITSSLTRSRVSAVAIPLNGGGVLIAGGTGGSSNGQVVDVYDPEANLFGASFSLAAARPDATFGFPLLLGGRALVGGGTTNTPTAADYIIP